MKPGEAATLDRKGTAVFPDEGPLDFCPELKQKLRENNPPSPDEFSDAEIIVLTTFLEGAKDPRRFIKEEYSDVFGQGLLDTETVTSTLAGLCARGVLVSNGNSSDTIKGFQQVETREIQMVLQSITRITRKIADDVAGLGSYACEHFSSDSNCLAHQLEETRTKLAEVFRALKLLRSQYVNQQLDRNGISAQTRGLRLNVGPGSMELPAPWINIDFSGRADLVMNLLWGLPFSNDTVAYIYGAHFLEHINYRIDALKIVTEFYRVLAPGGKLRLVVPNIAGYISAYVTKNETFFEDRCKCNPFIKPFFKSRLEQVLDYAGAGTRARPGEFFEHKFGYDFETLSALLHEAGFKEVVPSSYMGSSDPGLRVDDTGTFSSMEFGGIPNSLFVEATK